MPTPADVAGYTWGATFDGCIELLVGELDASGDRLAFVASAPEHQAFIPVGGTIRLHGDAFATVVAGDHLLVAGGLFEGPPAVCGTPLAVDPDCHPLPTYDSKDRILALWWGGWRRMEPVTFEQVRSHGIGAWRRHPRMQAWVPHGPQGHSTALFLPQASHCFAAAPGAWQLLYRMRSPCRTVTPFTSWSEAVLGSFAARRPEDAVPAKVTASHGWTNADGTCTFWVESAETWTVPLPVPIEVLVPKYVCDAQIGDGRFGWAVVNGVDNGWSAEAWWPGEGDVRDDASWLGLPIDSDPTLPQLQGLCVPEGGGWDCRGPSDPWFSANRRSRGDR